MDATNFVREIRKARRPEDRVAWFGALLAKEVGGSVLIVGGSAIEVYLSSASYVSQGIDVVGDSLAIENVLRKWKFQQVEGQSHRMYWTSGIVGLVDLVGRADSSGLSPRSFPTPHGPVWLSAPEPLIIRRLSRSKRENSAELFRQARELGRLGALDWEYLRAMARYEGVKDELDRLRSALARSPTKSTAEPRTRLG